MTRADEQYMQQQLVDRYVHDRLSRGEIVGSTAVLIRTLLRQWLTHVNNASPREWTTEQVASWVHNERFAPSTRKGRLTKLRPWCQWLIAEGFLERDPTARVASVRVPDGAPRDLTLPEVGEVLRVCPDQRARLIVLLMAQMGLRCGDVSRIRVGDVDVRRRSLHVRAKGGRGEPTHWVPIPAEAWLMMRPVATADVPRSSPLIVSRHDPTVPLSPGWISRLVRRWMAEAGVKARSGDGVSAHALRHTCAQHMIDGGADLREVQRALGHRSLRTTEGYVRRDPPGLRDAMEGRFYNAA